MIERMLQRVPLFWLLQIGGWCAFGLGMTLSRLGMLPLPFMVVNKGLLTLLGFGLSLGLRGIYTRVSERSWSPIRLLSLIVISSYLCTMVWTVSFGLSWTWLNSQMRGEPFVTPEPFFLVDGLLYLTFVMVAWSVLYFAIKYYQDLQVERERALTAEAEAHQAQLRALRYQLNPHFLFNTLNAISTLVVEQNNEAANRMIARLSDFLRLTLDGSDEDQVPLIEELEYANRYLEIEKTRFGDRLHVRIDVETAVFSALVPNLILQPLIENAVRHAITPQEEGGTVEISGKCIGNILYLCVQDNGPGLTDAEGSMQKGIGLANTQARLEALFPTEHKFELLRNDGGGLTVAITIPFITRPEHRHTDSSTDDKTPDSTVIELHEDSNADSR